MKSKKDIPYISLKSIKKYPCNILSGPNCSKEVTDAILSNNDRLEEYNWQFGSLSDYLDYFVSGQRTKFDDKYHENRKVLMGLIANAYFLKDTKLIDKIIDFAWFMSNENTWVIPCHVECSGYYDTKNDRIPDSNKRTFIDLMASESGAIIAVILKCFKQHINEKSTNVYANFLLSIQNKIIDPFLQNDDYWWMGFVGTHHPINNWNPWIISNILTIVACVDFDSNKKLLVTNKCVAILNNYIEYQPKDGGCDEGPVYWSASTGCLFDCIELLNKIGNCKYSSRFEKFLKKAGEYICSLHIAEDKFVSFADSLSVYPQSPPLIERFSKYVSSNEMNVLANIQYKVFTVKQFFEKNRFRVYRFLKDLECWNNSQKELASTILSKSYFIESLQIVSAKSNDNSLFFACKGGNNGESHNHNDLGSFVIYYNSNPVVIDVGCGNYTKDTFSEKRYSLWQMQSLYHNCLTFSDEQQSAGKQFAVTNFHYAQSKTEVNISMDLQKAYGKNANLKSYERVFTFSKNCNILKVCDTFEFLNTPQRVEASIMLLEKPDIGKGIINFNNQSGYQCILYDNKLYVANIKTILLEDPMMIQSWGKNVIYKLSLKSKAKIINGNMQVTFNFNDKTYNERGKLL